MEKTLAVTDFPRSADPRAHEPLLQCDYWDAGLCRSCQLIETPQDIQLADKQRRASALINAEQWDAPFASAREAFRNKVKLVATGTVERPNLGILGPDGDGVDLRDCALPSAGIRAAIPVLAEFVTVCELQPYSVRHDTGVLKYIIVTESPAGELMVRFVVRRRGVQGILFKRVDELLEVLPNIRAVSMNVQPERKAIIEGDEEIMITEAETLPMTLDVGTPTEPRELKLQLRPQSFFQTNSDAAAQLYRRAVEWSGNARSVWDLYCGVGGFALAIAGFGEASDVVGVETSEQATEAATEAASEVADGARARFIAADATEWAREQGDVPDLVVVNPPRRGIGDALATWINESGVRRVIYSSCNVETLARDLESMPDFVVERAQVVDMFAHTKHFETIVLLSRR